MKPDELKEKLNAVVVVMTTPFTAKDEVDIKGIRENTSFLIEKASGRPLVLVPTGSTGEFYTLSREEHKSAIKAVVEETDRRVPVVAGTGRAGTKESLEMSKYAEEVGADGVMIILPYYHVPTEEGMYQHFKEIAEGIDIGVMVYNNPDTTKVYIRPHLMARIAEIDGIIAVKENTNNIMMYYQMKKNLGDRLNILTGLGDFWFMPEFIFGSKGFISVIANYAPEVSLELHEAGLRKDVNKIQEIMKRMAPLFDFDLKVAAKYPSTAILPFGMMTSYKWLATAKAALDLRGLYGGKPRLPLLPLDETEKQQLKEVLMKMKIPLSK